MSLLRPILMLAVIVGACWFSTRFSEHHEATNEAAFQALYMHLMPAPLVVAGDAEAGHDGQAAQESHGAEGHAATRPLLAIPLPAFLAWFGGTGAPGSADPEHAQVVLTNLQVFQLAAFLLVLIAFSGVPDYLRTGRGDAISRVLAGACLFVRDEMVYPNMGKQDGDRFLPFFLSLGFFILFMNLLGLVPGSATATASIFVTGALAVITLASMLGAGMVAQGPVAYWKNLVPHVPAWLWPLMFVVELIGVLVKPFALMVRLFANMTGGHMVVLSFLGLIFFFAGVELNAAKGYAIAPVGVGFAVFIMIIEGFVACLQAYIFTQLSIIFVGMSIHPEH